MNKFSNTYRQKYNDDDDDDFTFLWADVSDDDNGINGTYGLTSEGDIVDADSYKIVRGDNREIYVRKILESITDDDIERDETK